LHYGGEDFEEALGFLEGVVGAEERRIEFLARVLAFAHGLKDIGNGSSLEQAETLET
jgi:hypothetical protein